MRCQESITTAMAPPILLATYAPPALRKGDRVTCLYRDAECVNSFCSTLSRRRSTLADASIASRLPTFPMV